MSVRSFSIFSLIYLIAIDFQSFGQSETKNYISVNIGLAAPLGKFTAGENTGSIGLLTSFATPQNSNSGSSLLLPPSSNLYFSAEGAYYLKKFFGIAAYGSYLELIPDGSGVQKTLDQLINQGAGALISQITQSQGQDEQTQQIIQSLAISSKANVTNWSIATFLAGPTFSHSSGKFTFDFKVLGGIMSVTTPKVDADINFSASYSIASLNGTLLRFSQPAVSKAVFAYQIGYGIRYSIIDHLAIRAYADYTSSVSANYDLTITTSTPSLNQINFFLEANGRDPINVTLPVAQKTTISFPITNLNVGIGVCFEFGSYFKNKKAEGELDIEMQKQQ